MRYSKRLIAGLLVLSLSIFLLVGCATALEDEASQPEEVAPVREDSQVKGELLILQGKYDKLSVDQDTVKNELETTQVKYDELSIANDELNTKYDELSTQYDELNTKHNELNLNYQILMEGTAGVNEEDIEQAIFELINLERKNIGLSELEWADGIYMWAKENSNDMATRKSVEYSEYNYWQEVFRAAGYSTIDRMAKATLVVWKESPQFELNILNQAANYGVVAVTKTNDIFYITYFSSPNK